MMQLRHNLHCAPRGADMVQNVLCANGYISKLCSVLFFSRRRSEGCLHLEPVLSSCLAQLPLVLSQSTPRYDLNVLDLPSCCSFLGQGPFFQNGDGFCLTITYVFRLLPENLALI